MTAGRKVGRERDDFEIGERMMLVLKEGLEEGCHPPEHPLHRLHRQLQHQDQSSSASRPYPALKERSLPVGTRRREGEKLEKDKLKQKNQPDTTHCLNTPLPPL